MSLDDALFSVNRGGTKYKVSGADIGTKIQNNDSVLVQRGTNKFKATYNNGFNKIQDTDLVLAYKGGSNYRVSGANFQALLQDPIVQITKWNWGSGPGWHQYGARINGEWETRNAKGLDKNGYKVYSNFGGEYASATDEVYYYPAEDGERTITGEAFSKYDDSSVIRTATVLVRGISINPARLQDTKDNIPAGQRMNPKLIMANTELLESKGTRLSCTWELRGMTKGNEEASFDPDKLVDSYYDSDNKNPPTVYRTGKTKNNLIELYAEGLNPSNYERARVSHYFTCQLN